MESAFRARSSDLCASFRSPGYQTSEKHLHGLRDNQALTIKWQVCATGPSSASENVAVVSFSRDGGDSRIFAGGRNRPHRRVDHGRRDKVTTMGPAWSGPSGGGWLRGPATHRTRSSYPFELSCFVQPFSSTSANIRDVPQSMDFKLCGVGSLLRAAQAD